VKTLAKIVAVSAMAVLLEGLAFSDTLFLKDGTKISGTYLGGSKAYVQFRIGNGTLMNYPLSSINWIHIDQSAPAPADPSPSSPSSSPVRPPVGQSSAPVRSSAVPANTGSNVPQDQAQAALDFQNSKRRDVGSPPLEWSVQLAAYAQKWANHLANDNNCVLDHTVNNNYGENLFGGSGRTYTALYASQDWYNEIQKYKPVVLSEDNWYATGHYTQLVWSNTRQVGIGQANCRGGGSVIAAEYDPPGNYMGEKPY
jgi:pathogenesis-related protein 1